MAKKLIVPEVDDQGEVVVQPTVVQVQAGLMARQNTFIRFRRRAMVQVPTPYPHFEPLNLERFKELFYPVIPGQTRSRVSDVYEQLTFAAPDYTANDHLILFGVPLEDTDIQADTDIALLHANPPSVWDCRAVATDHTTPTTACVWRSPYTRIPALDGASRRIPFIMSLAGDDPDLYDDIMQSMAPLIMERKPDGVIWWIGEGANGKSTLMDALYRLFPGQLSSITVKRLVDGRDTPNLNGTLANIVKESSEGRIDDTEIYKSIGTHEDFGAHKFHSQEGITIRGNLHHIFSGNSVPIFNDKGFSARRRTHIIPFYQQFESDPTFEERTFTPEFFGRLVDELCVYAAKLKRQGYRYQFSAKTRAAKADYDTEANNAEEYTQELLRAGVVAFDNFHDVRNDYEQWCREQGYVELGKGYMRRAILAVGFERMSVRDEAGTTKRYRLPDVEAKELRPVGNFRLGLYTYSDFTPEPEEPKPEVPEFQETAVTQKAGGW